MKLTEYQKILLNELLDKHIRNLESNLKYTSDNQEFQDLCSKYNCANSLKDKLKENDNEQ